MPIPAKKKGESIKTYIARLTKFFVSEGYEQKQAIAIAYSIAKKYLKQGQKKR